MPPDSQQHHGHVVGRHNETVMWLADHNKTVMLLAGPVFCHVVGRSGFFDRYAFPNCPDLPDFAVSDDCVDFPAGGGR
jgi:hypothetical protein